MLRLLPKPLKNQQEEQSNEDKKRENHAFCVNSTRVKFSFRQPCPGMPFRPRMNTHEHGYGESRIELMQAESCPSWERRGMTRCCSGFVLGIANIPVLCLPTRRKLSSSLQAVAKRIVVAPLEAAFLALSFPSLYQVLQTTGSLGRRFTTFGAAAFTLLAQLVLSLARDWHFREFVLNRSSHFSTCTMSIFVPQFRPHMASPHSK